MLKLENEEEKKEVIRLKARLKGRLERIDEDKTWRDRKLKWLLEEKPLVNLRKENMIRTLNFFKINDLYKMLEFRIRENCYFFLRLYPLLAIFEITINYL